MVGSSPTTWGSAKVAKEPVLSSVIVRAAAICLARLWRAEKRVTARTAVESYMDGWPKLHWRATPIRARARSECKLRRAS